MVGAGQGPCNAAWGRVWCQGGVVQCRGGTAHMQCRDHAVWCSAGLVQCSAGAVQVQSPTALGRGSQPPPARRHSRLRKALTWLISSRSSLLELSTRALVWFALSRAACARSRASSAFPLASAT